MIIRNVGISVFFCMLCKGILHFYFSPGLINLVLKPRNSSITVVSTCNILITPSFVQLIYDLSKVFCDTCY